MKDVLSIVTTIVLMVIYSPIIYLIVKRRRKKLTWYVVFPLAIIFLPILFLVVWFNVPYYYLPPFEGKVIDAETKEPISWAAVLAVYYGEYPTIAGANTYAIDAQETLTDEKGEFSIAELKEWFGDHPGTPVEANLIIFKPGYGAFPHHRGSRAVGENKSWPTPKKYIVYELAKLKTRQERDDNLMFIKPIGVPYQKMKDLVRYINQERKSLGYSGLTIPREEN
jgi:hypothetical protein